MTVKPYPSNIIIFNIDERAFDNEIKLALKRSWTHIGEILVRSHAGNETLEPSNFIHVTVKYGTRKFLLSNEEADTNWNERIEQHLLSTMRKISNNIVAFNRRQRKCGDPELAFDFIEFELEAGALTLEYRLDSNGCLPASCADIASDIRQALNEGILGEVTRVKIPSAKSYQEQVTQYAAEKAASSPDESVSADDDLLCDTADTQEDIEFIESPDLVAKLAEQEVAASTQVSPFEVAPLTEEQWEAEYGVMDADFEINYTIWEAVYVDGTSREFNPQSKEFIS